MPTPTRERVSARRTSSSLSANGLARELRLQPRLGGEEPALGHERGDRLPRVLEVGRGRRGVGGARGAAVAHAAPEVELPRRLISTPPWRPEPSPDSLPPPRASTSTDGYSFAPAELGVEQRLLDARRADAQIRVVGDRFGDRRRQLVVVERGEPVVGDDAPRRRRSRSTSAARRTVGIASSLIAAASGGFFSAHRADRQDRGGTHAVRARRRDDHAKRRESHHASPFSAPG